MESVHFFFSKSLHPYCIMNMCTILNDFMRRSLYTPFWSKAKRTVYWHKWFLYLYDVFFAFHFFHFLTLLHLHAPYFLLLYFSHSVFFTTELGTRNNFCNNMKMSRGLLSKGLPVHGITRSHDVAMSRGLRSKGLPLNQYMGLQGVMM